MTWFKRESSEVDNSGEKTIRTEGLWVKCEDCRQIIWKKDLEENFNCCPKCEKHFRIDARTRLAYLLDEGAYETDDGAMEYSFIGGSMGAVVGEMITRAVERATDTRTPLVVVSASGGARMMEGAISLMQLAKIAAALARMDEAKVPYLSILTDPTTGGVTASFAMLGDLNIAEPGALIGFAGPRVIEQTIRQKLPAGFQRAEFLLEHGMLDAVVPRKEMKAYIARALEFMTKAA